MKYIFLIVKYLLLAESYHFTKQSLKFTFNLSSLPVRLSIGLLQVGWPPGILAPGLQLRQGFWGKCVHVCEEMMIIYLQNLLHVDIISR